MEFKYVILGNGTAGHNAALAIRARDKEGSLVMVSDEPYRSYHRPQLTKALLSDMRIDQIAVKSEGWYEDNGITQILGFTAVKIDPEKKEVALNDGRSLHYEKLIYALGSECFVPPIKGREAEGVIAVRRFHDAQKVARLLSDTKHAVVIGGGVLGLEAAWELRQAGAGVTVLEVAPMLMGRQLDAEAGEVLKKICGQQGVAVETGVQVEEILCGADGKRVGCVKLADGREIPAQLVIISSGIRANTALAKDAGIQTERAVVVNEKMETNVPDIYACGDCAEFHGINYALVMQAMAEGKVAGAQAAGDSSAVYELKEPSLTFRGMNTSLFAAGDNGKNPEITYRTAEKSEPDQNIYRKYYFADNQLCGVILIGDTSQMMKMTKLLEKRAGYEEVLGA